MPNEELHERQVAPPPLLAYGTALAAVVAATAIRKALQPLLGNATPYAVHFLAILFAAAYGGLRPGLFAVILSALVGFRLFVQPDRQELAGVVLFTATGCTLAWISSGFRSAAHEARTAAERFRTTLASVGDAVIVTASDGAVRFMNPVAESLTGWTFPEAAGQPLANIFRTVNEITRATVESPVSKVIREGTVVGLANHTILISRQGAEIPIDDSGAPIRDTAGNVSGVVLVFRDVTERRRSEAALRASEEKHRIVAETATDAIVTIDEKSKILFVNPAITTIFGYQPEELLDKEITTLLPDYLTKYAPTGEKHLGWQAVELPGLHRSGRDIPLEISFGESREAGKHTFTGIVRDISGRKRAEVALRESEERFHTMADTIPVLIWMAGLDRVCTWFNKPWLAFRGRSLEQEISNGWMEGVHPDDRAKCVSAYESSFDDRREFRMEYRLAGADGEYRWILGHCVPRLAPDGTFLGYIGSGIDITDRKRAQEQRFQLAAIVESSDDAIIGKTLDGIITSWNPGAQLVYGYQREEAVGRHVSMLVPAGRADEVPEILRRLRLGEHIEQYETKRVRKDGALIDVSVTISPVRSETGEIIGASAVARDITERRRSEQERAALLEREKSAHAEAENANRVKDEFLATLSHELRTPLQAVLGYAKLLRTGRLDPPAATQAIQTIERNAVAQAVLIEDLLDLSRIITGKLAIDVQPHDLAPLAEAALDSVRPAAHAKGITLSASIDPHLGLVSVDGSRLQQAMWNLLSNGVKFTPPGGQVSLHVARVGAAIEITVSDTGIGIAPEFRPHVFEPFRQAESSTTRRHGGLGLGLSIVRRIVEMHGGTVEVESEGLGKGATFRINLPLRPLVVPAIDASRSALYQGSEEPSPDLLDGLSVLVVDDHPDSRQLLSISLQRYGASVTTADSAHSALDLLQHSLVDVIVSDIGMPGEDGLSLLRKLRAGGTAAAHIPAIALTGYVTETDRSRTKEAGFQLHVAKPVDPAILGRAVAKLAGRI